MGPRGAPRRADGDLSTTGTAARSPSGTSSATGTAASPAWCPPDSFAALGADRWEGAKGAADEAGIQLRRVDVGYVREDILQVVRGWQHETDPPTAVFANNDDFALMIISALRGCGWSVPDDMAVVGADDLPFCDLVWPRLTSVAMHTRTMGGGAVDALTALMENKPCKHRDHMVVHPRVVVRESG
ncbi:substrate-binding domain-containing protein [Yinghuangia aomiensis]